MTYKRFLEIKTLIYDCTVAMAFSDKDDQLYINSVTRLAKLNAELDTLSIKRLDQLQGMWMRDINRRMKKSIDKARKEYIVGLSKEGLKPSDADNATIFRLTGKVCSVLSKDGETLLRIEWRSVDVEVKKNERKKPMNYWMEKFDTLTNLECKKDESDFVVKHLTNKE